MMADGVCPVPECRSNLAKRLGPLGRYVYADYCKHHTCHAFDPTDGAFCSSSVLLDHAFCSVHKKCGITGCNNSPDLPRFITNGPPPLVRPHPSHVFFCGNHICHHKNGCQKPRHPKSEFCDEHEPRCVATDCAKPRASYKYHCRTHACEEPNCQELAFKIKGLDRKLCAVHLPRCSADRCTEVTRGRRHYCAQHACDEPECQDMACDVTSLGQKLCAGHLPRCHASGCNAVPDGRNHHCNKHACEASGCQELASTPNGADQKLCPKHTCRYVGCHGYKLSQAHACHLHRCKAGQCPSPISKGSYCERHVCAVADCRDAIDTAGDYCPSHRCQMTPCTRRAKQKNGYCSLAGHGCSVDACGLRATGNDPLPHLCAQHYYITINDEATKRAEADANARVDKATKEAELRANQALNEALDKIQSSASSSGSVDDHAASTQNRRRRSPDHRPRSRPPNDHGRRDITPPPRHHDQRGHYSTFLDSEDRDYRRRSGESYSSSYTSSPRPAYTTFQRPERYDRDPAEAVPRQRDDRVDSYHALEDFLDSERNNLYRTQQDEMTSLEHQYRRTRGLDRERERLAREHRHQMDIFNQDAEDQLREARPSRYATYAR